MFPLVYYAYTLGNKRTRTCTLCVCVCVCVCVTCVHVCVCISTYICTSTPSLVNGLVAIALEGVTMEAEVETFKIKSVSSKVDRNTETVILRVFCFFRVTSGILDTPKNNPKAY